MSGSALKNHYRVTPMGTLKPAWLTLKDHPDCDAADRLPWKKIAIFNVLGFLDFYTQFIADEFRKWVLKVGFIRLISLLWNICVKILLR